MATPKQSGRKPVLFVTARIEAPRTIYTGDVFESLTLTFNGGVRVVGPRSLAYATAEGIIDLASDVTSKMEAMRRYHGEENWIETDYSNLRVELTFSASVKGGCADPRWYAPRITEARELRPALARLVTRLANVQRDVGHNAQPADYILAVGAISAAFVPEYALGNIWREKSLDLRTTREKQVATTAEVAS